MPQSARAQAYNGGSCQRGEGAAPVTGPGHALGGGVVGALLFLSSMSKEPWKEVARNPGGLILEGLSSHSGAWW